MRTIALVLLLFASAGPIWGDREFYLAVDGDDANSGTKAKPFATLTRARDEVRKAKKVSESITVYLRGGEYKLAETVVFSIADSAPEGSAITYAAYPGEKVVIGSGVAVTGWKKLRGDIWVAPIPKELKGKLFRTLYDAGRRLPRASRGFCPASSPKGKKGYPVVDENYDVLRRLEFPRGALRNWSNLSDVEVVIRPHNAWVLNILALESVDERAGVAMTTIPGTYALNRCVQVRPGGISAWVENVLEALDEPGEWSVDTRAGKVYLRPTGKTPGDRIAAPRLTELIRVEGDIDITGPKDKPVVG